MVLSAQCGLQGRLKARDSSLIPDDTAKLLTQLFCDLRVQRCLVLIFKRIEAVVHADVAVVIPKKCSANNKIVKI